MRGGLLVNPPKIKRPRKMADVIYTNRGLINRIRTRMLQDRIIDGKTECALNSYRILPEVSDRFFYDKDDKKFDAMITPLTPLKTQESSNGIHQPEATENASSIHSPPWHFDDCET